MAQVRRFTAHPTVAALLIGGLVLAAGIALVVVLAGRSGSGSRASDDDRAAAAQVTGSVPAAASTTTAPTTSPRTSATSAVRPSVAPSSRPARSTARPTGQRPSGSATKRPPARGPITYVVKKGDNLTVIAAWFHQHGYGALYERNRHAIGRNPDLIFPGQHITITSGGSMTMND